ncbi:glutathione S-transferase family protein [Psychrobacter sp. I-STPA10]|uniref:glutathione S-transferase family protein n=1 Tax=Psychrobacter sp. I-STPA10 TaxID=2585769 RepID=UPI001E2F7A69|nr:glutathione S-transferase family protein [Psychrobacter sp. I-STPA10]
MNKPLLIIGNKNYSSWSLRAWLLLKMFDIDFNEHPIALFSDSSKPILQAHSATGKVPVLVDDGINICDSLAIALYVNDYLTDKSIWGNEKNSKAERSHCQSLVAEMHSGLMGIRSEMPMNIRATARIQPSKQCLADIARVEQIFAQCLQNKAKSSDLSEGYLFGEFSVADAFFAPVIFRLKTYADASKIALKPTTEKYCEVMLSNPYMQQWQALALQETQVIADDEAGEIVRVVGVLG